MTSFTAPTSGLIVHRHPQGKKILQDIKSRQLPLAYISPPPGHRLRGNIQGTDWWERMDLLHSDVGNDLAKVFGKHDGVVPGKYRRAQVFCFEFEQQTLIAVCEKGDRGSQWFWVTPSSQSIFDADHPDVASFWPDFVEALFDIHGKLIPDHLVPLVFGEESLPAQRRRQLRAKELGLELAEAVQGQAQAARPGPRL